MSFSQAFDAYMLYMAVEGRSRRTQELYREILTRFLGFVGDRLLSEITSRDLRAYIAHLQGQGCKHSTINIHLRAIRAWLNFLYREGMLAEKVAERVKLLRTPKQYPFVLSDAQVTALLRAASSHKGTWVGFRNYTMILTFLDTGLRLKELLALTVDDLDLNRRALKVIGKGNREREVFFGRRLGRVLRDWLARRTLSLPGDALFCSRKGDPLKRRYLIEIVTNLAKEAGITGVRCSPHTLRHTFATQFIRNGGDPFALQRLLGHSDISTTMIYVHMAGTALREAHAKASPIDRLLE
ncbi:MAG: tyrosine-type recombinase/integrase [Candidatus Bipolaricaulota bacterium]|nr:tyrosine-type recombinase/integrase [Candidatus Bipolaricaulota bacterium]MDW8030824.1 tyrosine-type recombinase/integrase [Candidatus Bipolaricaulota bacterium]